MDSALEIAASFANYKWATTAAVLYFIANVLLIAFLSLLIHTQGHDEESLLKAVWSRRAIYGQILVHLYDTATDIGVLIEWFILAYDGTDYQSVNMKALFWASILFQFIYRCMCALFAGYMGYQDNKYNGCCDYCWIGCCCTNCCLGCCDMYILKTIYQTFKGHKKEPTQRQRNIQFMEAIFESLPQVLYLHLFAFITITINTTTMTITGCVAICISDSKLS